MLSKNFIVCYLRSNLNIFLSHFFFEKIINRVIDGIPLNYSETKKNKNRKDFFFMIFLSPLRCSDPEIRKLNLQRDSDRYSVYTRQSAANGHVHSVFARLAALDLRLDTDRQSVLISGISIPHGTPPRVLLTDNDDDDDTLDTLRWDFQKFKDLARFAILRLNSASRMLFFCVADVLRIFLEVSISTNRTESKQVLDKHSAHVFCNFLTQNV